MNIDKHKIRKRALTLILLGIVSTIIIVFTNLKPALNNPITFVEFRSLVFGWNWFNTNHILHYQLIIVIGYENYEIPVFLIILPFFGKLAFIIARYLGVI